MISSFINCSFLFFLNFTINASFGLPFIVTLSDWLLLLLYINPFTLLLITNRDHMKKRIMMMVSIVIIIFIVIANYIAISDILQINS